MIKGIRMYGVSQGLIKGPFSILKNKINRKKIIPQALNYAFSDIHFILFIKLY